MDDKEQITKLYHDMYAAMVAKDEAELERVHDESFVLIHMTGMHQSKHEYIKAIMDGTLNYYSEQTDHLDVDINGDTAILIGRSRVYAAVFGGGRHECPKGIRIPDMFSSLNAHEAFHNWNTGYYYNNIITGGGHGKASDCIKCGKCEKVCPQHLPIRDILKDVARTFE